YNFYLTVLYFYLKFRYLLLGTTHVLGFFMACKKKDFLKIGGFNEKLKVLEDFDFSERMSKLGKISFVESTFVLTSSRRIRKWGLKAIPKYLTTYLYYIIFKNDKIGKIFWKPIR
ncbi:MAG: glycosyltransferase, partial [Candidatus Aenigmatarchaeota archaeon]